MRGRTAIEIGITAVLAFVVSLIALSPTLSNLGQPWSGGDMLSTYVNVDNWGWLGYSGENHFGYPLGMDLNLFPSLDVTQNIFAKIVSSLSGNPYVGINLLLVLSFPLVAVLAYISIRLTSLRGPLAIALATSFTFIPFHFARGLGHTYLATLYGAVAAVILAQLIGTGRLRKWDLRKGFAVGVLVVLTAWSGVYYTVFGLILMAAAWLWLWATAPSRRINRELIKSAIPILGILLLAVVATVPSIIAGRVDPPFIPLAVRTPYESVIFAGILIMAILPAPISKLALLANYNIEVSGALAAAPAYENATQGNYGTWITLAALVVVGIALFTRVRGSLGFLGMLLTTSLLFFIPWGLNYLFAATVTPQIRAWNRLIPIILLLVILLAATVLARIVINYYAVIGIAALIIGVTAVESVWPWRAIYASNTMDGKELSNALTNYNNQVNAAAPENCAILQLPHVPYPENGPLREMNDYEHFWQPLTNSNKSWSYGAVNNTRAGSWLSHLPEVPGNEEVQLLAEAGFCGIHLDTRAFVPNAQERIVTDLTERYGQPVATGGVEQVGEFPDWLFFLTDPNAKLVDPINWSQRVSDYFFAPAIRFDPSANTIAPRGSKDALAWWWTIAPAAQFTIYPVDPNTPLTGITTGIRIPTCADVDQAPVTVTLATDSNANQVSETVLANPKTTTELKLELPTSTNSNGNNSTGTLTISSPIEGCAPEGFPLDQFVQVIDLVTR